MSHVNNQPSTTTTPPSGKPWHAIASAPEWGRRGLSRRERRIVFSFVQAALAEVAEDGCSPLAAERAWCQRIVASYDLAVGNGSRQLRMGIAALLRALNWLPLVVVGKPLPMTALPLRDRIRYLEALERHRWGPFTVLLVACKVPMLMPAFEVGEALAMTGFDRPHIAARRRLPVVDNREEQP